MIVDLTRTMHRQMPVYPGDTPVEITPAGSEGIFNHILRCSMHSGTHIDSPSHMIKGGKKLTDYSVEKFIGPGICIDARGMSTITQELLSEYTIHPGDTVLVYTGFDEYFNEKRYFSEYPALTEEAAQYLIASGASLLGLDTPSPDYAPFWVHKLLFENDILIIENLTNLQQLVDKKFEVIALPIKLETDGALARVVARLA